MSAVDDLKVSVAKLVTSVKAQQDVLNGMQSATEIAQAALAEEKAAHRITQTTLADTNTVLEALKTEVDAAVTAGA